MSLEMAGLMDGKWTMVGGERRGKESGFLSRPKSKTSVLSQTQCPVRLETVNYLQCEPRRCVALNCDPPLDLAED